MLSSDPGNSIIFYGSSIFYYFVFIGLGTVIMSLNLPQHIILSRRLIFANPLHDFVPTHVNAYLSKNGTSEATER